MAMVAVAAWSGEAASRGGALASAPVSVSDGAAALWSELLARGVSGAEGLWPPQATNVNANAEAHTTFDPRGNDIS